MSNQIFNLLISVEATSKNGCKLPPEQKILVSSANKTNDTLLLTLHVAFPQTRCLDQTEHTGSCVGGFKYNPVSPLWATDQWVWRSVLQFILWESYHSNYNSDHHTTRRKWFSVFSLLVVIRAACMNSTVKHLTWVSAVWKHDTHFSEFIFCTNKP